MASKVHRYEGKDCVVTYDLMRCIHAAECVHGLPEVFDPKAKPWISPDAAGLDDLRATVALCPTGALHLEGADGRVSEPPAPWNSVMVAADGPLYLRGRIQILDATGSVSLDDTRVALCRCGASNNKPYCDGSHSGADFEDAGDLGNVERSTTAPDVGGPIQVTLAHNGPLLVKGPCTLQDAFGDDVCSADGTALCRCGHSANKPFCDGSHKRVGFQDGT